MFAVEREAPRSQVGIREDGSKKGVLWPPGSLASENQTELQKGPPFDFSFLKNGGFRDVGEGKICMGSPLPCPKSLRQTKRGQATRGQEEDASKARAKGAAV